MRGAGMGIIKETARGDWWLSGGREEARDWWLQVDRDRRCSREMRGMDVGFRGLILTRTKQ